MGKEILVVKDVHIESSGREQAKKILQSEKIDVFFIEWAKPIEKDKIKECFKGIAPADALPSLIELATLAISRGIDVVSCDLTVEETLKQLDALKDGYAPYKEFSVFEPWGESVRDKNAAEKIAGYMKIKKECRGLVMFGADHFAAKEGRIYKPLDVLIKEKTGIDCCFK